MNVKKKSANSGIDALLGFNFQRKCAMFLLLNNYNRFKEREFVLSLGHHPSVKDNQEAHLSLFENRSISAFLERMELL